MTASLSSSITSASVAVLGAAAVVTTYVADKYEDLAFFYVVMAAAAATLVESLLLGGSGVYEIAQKGYDGGWAIATEKRSFDKQVKWMLAGIALLLLGAFIGLSAKRRDTTHDAPLAAIAGAIREDAHEIRALNREQRLLSAVNRRLARDLRLLAKRTRDGSD
jgi:hypothetical protein